VRLPLLELRANHSPNPGLRKSLISGGTSAWKSKKSEKSKMSNRLTFEFAVKVRNQPFANCIYVLERGRIVESGRHEDLLASKGLYSAMWRQQVGEGREKLLNPA
jgi:hypothetical protein